MSGIIEFFTRNNGAEIVGTLANLILIFTYSLHGEKRIRTMSIVGSAVSAVYNLMLHSTAFFLLSCIIILINIYHLVFLKPE